MAENEYLDSTKARRWLSVADGIRDGCGIDVLSDRAQSQFYKTIQVIHREIPLSELLSLLINDPEKLRQRCNEIDGASDVKSFLVEASLANDNPADAIFQFLGDALQNCFYDIPYLAAERGQDVNVSHARRSMEEVRLRLNPDLRRMAEKMAANPSWKPRKQRNTNAGKFSVDNAKMILRQSLIAGFRK